MFISIKKKEFILQLIYDQIVINFIFFRLVCLTLCYKTQIKKDNFFDKNNLV